MLNALPRAGVFTMRRGAFRNLLYGYRQVYDYFTDQDGVSTMASSDTTYESAREKITKKVDFHEQSNERAWITRKK